MVNRKMAEPTTGSATMLFLKVLTEIFEQKPWLMVNRSQQIQITNGPIGRWSKSPPGLVSHFWGKHPEYKNKVYIPKKKIVHFTFNILFSYVYYDAPI